MSVLPLNKPAGLCAELSPDAGAVLRFLFLALVPRADGMTDEEHIDACTLLADAGFLWFAQSQDQPFQFKRRVAGQPDNAPWVDCSAAFAGTH